jgi:hypothetical protein
MIGLFLGRVLSLSVSGLRCRDLRHLRKLRMPRCA